MKRAGRDHLVAPTVGFGLVRVARQGAHFRVLRVFPNPGCADVPSLFHAVEAYVKLLGRDALPLPALFEALHPTQVATVPFRAELKLHDERWGPHIKFAFGQEASP